MRRPGASPSRSARTSGQERHRDRRGNDHQCAGEDVEPEAQRLHAPLSPMWVTGAESTAVDAVAKPNLLPTPVPKCLFQADKYHAIVAAICQSPDRPPAIARLSAGIGTAGATRGDSAPPYRARYAVYALGKQDAGSLSRVPRRDRVDEHEFGSPPRRAHKAGATPFVQPYAADVRRFPSSLRKW